MSSTKLLSESFLLQRCNDNSFQGEIPSDFTHEGGVHGGYLVTLVLDAIKLHSSTPSNLQESRILTLHVEFLRSVTPNPVQIEIENVKAGRRVKTVHVKLTQGDRVKLVAYALVAVSKNLSQNGGHVDFPFTGLSPAPRKVSLDLLERNVDDRWFASPPMTDERLPLKCWNLVQNYFPSPEIVDKDHRLHTKATTIDQWLTPAQKDDVFTTNMLGFLTDIPPTPYENTLSRTPFSITGSIRRVQHSKNVNGRDSLLDKEPIDDGLQSEPVFFYPSLNLTLDIVRDLPKDGVKWLFVRIAALEIENGAMSFDTTVLDADGRLVARATQKALVVNMGRANKL